MEWAVSRIEMVRFCARGVGGEREVEVGRWDISCWEKGRAG
jgi:hypothetical protein